LRAAWARRPLSGAAAEGSSPAGGAAAAGSSPAGDAARTGSLSPGCGGALIPVTVAEQIIPFN
jgi:hypothetical protein